MSNKIGEFFSNVCGLLRIIELYKKDETAYHLLDPIGLKRAVVFFYWNAACFKFS